MQKAAQPERVRLCLVSDDEAVHAAVRVACPLPHELITFSIEGLTDIQEALSSHGKAIVDAAATADAILVAWRMDKAPVINTLSHFVHRTMPVPVFALCGGNPEDQVAALAAGADDALTFPLYLPLVQMRTAVYHRRLNTPPPTETRTAPTAGPAAGPAMQHFGKLRLDGRTHRFYVEDQDVPLTPREFKLLNYLIENADAACSRDQILDVVWGIDFETGTNMVDVYMYFLRKKLGAYGLKNMIQTVRGLGYRLTLNDPDASSPA